MQNDFQKIGTDNYEAMSRSYGELNRGPAIFARWVEFSKRSFDDATRTWEKLIAVKSLDQAFEIQANLLEECVCELDGRDIEDRRDVFVDRTRRLQAGREDIGEAQGLSCLPAHPFEKDPGRARVVQFPCWGGFIAIAASDMSAAKSSSAEPDPGGVTTAPRFRWPSRTHHRLS